ncbi:hypothetical protein AB833_10180 [Chromatiales bacterium (ex Bugula neritina AB1)]|nr:hypothetical protein AB833_10180 [Chromatiales bacterium (ex Bugula neritina AB1)]
MLAAGMLYRFAFMKSSKPLTLLLSAIKTPLYLAQIFTGAKSFHTNPVIGSHLLNVMGLHVMRVVLAAAVTRLRLFCLRGFVPPDQRASFLRDGYLKIEGYLGEDEFRHLNDEVRSMRGEVRECIQGDTLTHRLLLRDEVLKKHPFCRGLLTNKKFSRLMKYTASRNSTPIYYVQSIKSNMRPGIDDPQRTFHSDTFHPTMKAWLFLDDVSDRNGPLTYVAGSQRLSWQRLKWEYRNSVSGSKLENTYASRGSLRITEAEIQKLGLPEPTAFRVPANTLVIANTHGFHRRGEAIGGPTSRLELWAYSRTNPFNPLPGFDFNWYRRASHFAIDSYLRYQDRKAEKKGALASWHIVADDALQALPMEKEAVAVAEQEALVSTV